MERARFGPTRIAGAPSSFEVLMPPRQIFLLAFALLVASALVGGQCTAGVSLLLNDRKFDEARTVTQAAVSANPNDDRGIHCLGVIAMNVNKPREAITQFEHAIKVNDTSSLHHEWLGNALGSIADSTSKLKQPFLAPRIKSEFERAVVLNPRNTGARHGLIQFYSQAPGFMGGSMDKAKEQAREIQKVSLPQGHWEMANLLLREKKIDEAEAEYVEVINSAPDSANFWLRVGTHYQDRQMWPQAFSLYDRMLKQFPLEQNVHFQIGRTAAVSGEQLARGETELKGWIAAPPKNAIPVTIAGAHHRLGMIYEKQGRTDLARAEYNRALEIDPKSDNAKKSLAALKP
jgi:tetratricopeptide (TPR) repeat protein